MGRYYVSVDGQLDIPFDDVDEAKKYAEHMNKNGFGCVIFDRGRNPSR